MARAVIEARISASSFVHVKKCSAQHAEEITTRTAEMVSRDQRPISILEGVGFKNLLSYLGTGYCVPSHTPTATVCRHLYNVQKERFKEEIADCSNENRHLDKQLPNSDYPLH